MPAFAGFFMCGFGASKHSRFGLKTYYLYYGGLGRGASARRFV
jgi:hypothetical protein